MENNNRLLFLYQIYYSFSTIKYRRNLCEFLYSLVMAKDFRTYKDGLHMLSNREYRTYNDGLHMLSTREWHRI